MFGESDFLQRARSVEEVHKLGTFAHIDLRGTD